MPQPPDHPEFGAMQLLAEGLDVAHAEMLSQDLRDLSIPAIVTRPDDLGGDAIDGVLGGSHFAMQIFVPAALHEVALQVLDVHTHGFTPEGPTPTAEILTALDDPEAAAATASAAAATPRPTHAGARVLAGGVAVLVLLFALRACG